MVLQMVQERTQAHLEARLRYESQAAHLMPVLDGRPPSTQLLSKREFRSGQMFPRGNFAELVIESCPCCPSPIAAP